MTRLEQVKRAERAEEVQSPRETVWLEGHGLTKRYAGRAVVDEAHRLGHAHSMEVWDGERLIGGIYGVAVGPRGCGGSTLHGGNGGAPDPPPRPCRPPLGEQRRPPGRGPRRHRRIPMPRHPASHQRQAAPGSVESCMYSSLYLSLL